jgi:8-oxo-dGTP pyrophosphatase MutT (NUDIX family)
MPEADAAVAIVHAPDDSVLLIRRAEREGDPWSGHWSFPGGRSDPGDKDALHTALRELEEECGIRLDREQMETALPLMNARRRVGRHLLVAPFVFKVDRRFPAVLQESEAVEELWVSLAALRDPASHRLGPVHGMPEEMLFPSVVLNGLPLWGFTYRLIADWQKLVSNGGAFQDEVLQFLIEKGLKVTKPWTNRAAEVEGALPLDLVRRRFAGYRGIPPVNLLELRPGQIRITSLAYEDYFIRPAGCTIDAR